MLRTDDIDSHALAAPRSSRQKPGASGRSKLSLVVPFFNEGVGVDAFHHALLPALAGLGSYTFEIVCVDDGSTDDTLVRLLAMADLDARFKVVELSRNFGKEAALTAGLDQTAGDAVIALDADLQDPPALIGRMVREWEQGADVVLARRVSRRTDTFLKRKSAQWFYRMHNLVSDIAIPPNVGDFRLMDRRVVDALADLPERHRFMKGLFCWVGFRTTLVDYERAPRAVGSTKFPGWKLWNFALEGITSFSTAPLRVWTYVGLASALLTAAYGLYTLLKTLILGVELPGYASLLLATLFFGSINLISLGLLGEYIGRIYIESKQRPIYIVRNVFGSQAAQPAAAPAGNRRRSRRRQLAWGSGTAAVRPPSRFAWPVKPGR